MGATEKVVSTSFSVGNQEKFHGCNGIELSCEAV